MLAMVRPGTLAIVLFACASAAPLARASRLIVPDQAPTIQAALDSHVDTVLVRPGSYGEAPVISERVVLMAVGEYPGALNLAVLSGLSISVADPGLFECRRLRINSRVLVTNGYSGMPIRFVECELPAGIEDVSQEIWTNDMSFSKCSLGGLPAPAARFTISLDSCQVTGPLLQRQRYELTLSVRGCSFQGDGTGSAVSSTYNMWACHVENSRIRGYAAGVGADAEEVVVTGNVIENCSGRGVSAMGHELTVANNVIRRCGLGVYAYPYGRASVAGNRIEQAAGDGIYLDAETVDVLRNVVWDCGGNGISVYGNGFLYIKVSENTSCLNTGSGYVTSNSYSSPPALEWTRNIGYRNGRHGLLWVGAVVGAVGCNDWFGNQLGDVEGRAPAGTDLSLDPRFCNVEGGDFQLQSDSPLLDWPGCGRVGALGMGCGATATLVQRFGAERVADGIRVIWEVAEGATASEVWVERSDASDEGPWARPITERSLDDRAVVELDGGALPDRAYWYRLVALERNGATVIGSPMLVEAEARRDFRLGEVGPSPGSGPVRIAFALSHAAGIEIDVFDVQGRKVATLGRGVWAAGTHDVVWDGRVRNGEAARAGVYVVRYVYPGGQDRRRVVQVR